MKFNKINGQIMHLGRGNSEHQYELGGAWLKISPAEQDLGLLVSSRLTVSKQSAQAAKRANFILGTSKAAQPDSN